MLCTECDFLNQDDSRFCAMCGHELQEYDVAEYADDSTGAVSCPSCSALNDEGISYCRFCGSSMIVSVASQSIVAAAVGSTLDMISSMSSPIYDRPRAIYDESRLIDNEPSIIYDEPRPIDNEPSAIEDAVDQEPLEPEESSHHESMIAKLDMMERELQSRLGTLPEAITEDVVAGDQDDALSNLSMTLDSLISDLLDVEIKEYERPDFIHPDESGFPSRDPTAYKPTKPKKGISVQEIMIIIALIAAIFLVGMSCGLWGSYFMGL